MKKLKSISILICIEIVLLISCEDDTGIFNDSFKHFYGEWKLYATSGGWDGQGYELTFDYLIVEKIDNYRILRNDTIQEFGKIIIVDQDNDELIIEFESKELKRPLLAFPSARVHLRGSDTLSLNSNVPDLYNYHFIRK